MDPAAFVIVVTSMLAITAAVAAAAAARTFEPVDPRRASGFGVCVGATAAGSALIAALAADLLTAGEIVLVLVWSAGLYLGVLAAAAAVVRLGPMRTSATNRVPLVSRAIVLVGALAVGGWLLDLSTAIDATGPMATLVVAASLVAASLIASLLYGVGLAAFGRSPRTATDPVR